MKYGFIIDNRKCIGCHACTVACKAEHDVAIGVNRTWVKQVEKGTYPHTRRLFSVMRCNHCTDAPCVEICPVQALYTRPDGIVDFDNDRCIACKSCMQACPYDALYIDPETHTAAKCNYCAHRVDIGLEPACVNVCPEHAIISGDMEDESSEIYELLSREQVTVRKGEKGTQPNLFYIDGDESSLVPGETSKSAEYFWSSQSRGVGHFAKYAEKQAESSDLVAMLMELQGKEDKENGRDTPLNEKSIDVLLGKARRIYDSPEKGILWGWEVSGYVFTKAIAAGAFLVMFLGLLFGQESNFPMLPVTTGLIGLVFLLATGLLLIKDLDQPKRFVYVLLRPQWKSWLVRGGYIITIYGALLTAIIVTAWFEWQHPVMEIIYWIGAVFAVLTAVYTAFLFSQAKGRDFWQSPTLSLHMLVHSVMAGAAALLIAGFFLNIGPAWTGFLQTVLAVGIGANLVILFTEIATPHPTEDAHTTVKMITKGRYRNTFWWGTVILGNLIPLVFLLANLPMAALIASVTALAGIAITEKIWVEAPQRIPLV